MAMAWWCVDEEVEAQAEAQLKLKLDGEEGELICSRIPSQRRLFAGRPLECANVARATEL